jgi:hypothetical protein
MRDAARQRQPQSRTSMAAIAMLACWIGAVERLENMGEILRRDPLATIHDT